MRGRADCGYNPAMFPEDFCMSDALFSFLLFLAASALIIAYFVLVYAVIRAVRHCWLYYKNEFIHSHGEWLVEFIFGDGYLAVTVDNWESFGF